MALFSGSARQTSYTQAELNALVPSAHVGRVYTLAETGDLVYSDGTNWVYARPVNDVTTASAFKPLAAAQGVSVTNRLAAVETLHARIKPKLTFTSREAFVALLSTDTQLGAKIVALGNSVRFERFYAAGPDVVLEYRLTNANPTTDPTAITLVAGSWWLTQRFASTGAHADQFGFLYDGSNEAARWTAAISSALVTGIEIPKGKYIGTASTISVPSNKFVVVNGGFGGFKATQAISGNSTTAFVLTVGTRATLRNVEIDGGGFFAGGFDVNNTSFVTLERCYFHHGLSSSSAGGHGIWVRNSNNIFVESPRVFLANTGIKLDTVSDVIVSDVDVSRVINGVEGTGCIRTIIAGGTVRDCSGYGTVWSGEIIDSWFSDVTVSRCNFSEARITSGTGASARHAKWMNCQLTHEANYTDWAGASATASTSNGAIQFDGVNGGTNNGKGVGVYNCQIRSSVGSFFIHADTTAYSLISEREFTIHGCDVRHESTAALFNVNSNAHALRLVDNSFFLASAVTASSAFSNVQYGLIEGNRIQQTATSSVNIIHVTNSTTIGICYIRGNTFDGGTTVPPLKLTSNLTGQYVLSQNDFIKSFTTTKGGIDVANNIAPTYLDQQFRVVMTKTTAGTTESFALTNTSDFTRMFTATNEGTTVGGPALGILGLARVHMSMTNAGTNYVNAYDLTIGAGYSAGSTTLDSLQGTGSGSGLLKKTDVYITSFSAGTVNFTKPVSGLSATIWLVFDAIRGKHT